MPEIHSIPLLFTGSQWQLFAVARSFPVHFGDHLQSEDHLWLGIIYDTVQSHLTNDVISCNYTNYCIQCLR